ncbi:MAG: transposase [Patescibacteria group bacterium]
MRVEPFTVDSYVHALKRGARGLEITGDKADKWRFLRLLFYMNDERDHEWWERDTEGLQFLEWPSDWPARKPIVKILCYTLMPNHFHIILKEIKEGGISKFMKKIGGSMSKHFNEKYQSKGSIFQGSYKSRTIDDDRYIRYLAAYIMVKNTFELYPSGGLAGAQKNFDVAWEWAITYEFSSLADYCGKRESVIIDKDILGEIFTEKSFKSFSQDLVLGGKWQKKGGDEEFARLAIE